VLVPRAWHWQCLTCDELVADQLELVEDRPGGAAIQLHRCRLCGTSRACRIGWTTRCHICLDERSTGPDVTEAGKVHLALLDGNPRLAAQAKQFLGLKTAEAMPLRSAIEAASYVTLAEQLSRRDRPGWVILEMWKAGTADAAERLCLPDVDQRALEGLKFNEALPERLATATLFARLADIDSATQVLAEPARFCIVQEH
jgi:hypothetical protein